MISQSRGEKGTKPRPCLPHTASPGAAACPAPAPAPSPPRSHGRPPPRTKVPRGTSASGGENQFPFPFRNKPAGEGGTFPQPSFRTEGRQADAATAGCKDTATPAALMEPIGGRPDGLSSSRWEQAEGAAPGRWCWQAGQRGAAPGTERGPGPQGEVMLIRQGAIKKQIRPAVSCLPEWDGNQINKLS